MLRHCHKIDLERAGVLAASGGHPEIIRGVRAARVGHERRQPGADPRPGCREHRHCRRDEDHAVSFALLDPQLCDGGSHGVHGVGSIEGRDETRDLVECLHPSRSERASETAAGVDVGKTAIPEQRANVLEAGAHRQVLDLVAGDDEFAPLSVDEAERGLCDLHALEAAGGHRLRILPVQTVHGW